MKRKGYVLILLAVLQMGACKNRSQPQAPQPETEQSKSEPDNNDLLQTLQGRWRSEADSTYVVEFMDSKMRHLNKGTLSFETDVEVDGSCSNVSCQDAANSEDGWCFLEKGQFDIQCHLVLKCNTNELQFVAVGAANGLLSFKKIR